MADSNIHFFDLVTVAVFVVSVAVFVSKIAIS